MTITFLSPCSLAILSFTNASLLCARARQPRTYRARATYRAMALQCGEAGAFTDLSFRNAELVQSNLGGQGGRCQDVTFRNGLTTTWQSLCEEPQPGITHANSTSASGRVWPAFTPSIPDSLGGPYGHEITAPTPGGAPFGNQHILFRNLGTRSTYNALGTMTSSAVIWCASPAARASMPHVIQCRHRHRMVRCRGLYRARQWWERLRSGCPPAADRYWRHPLHRPHLDSPDRPPTDARPQHAPGDGLVGHRRHRASVGRWLLGGATR